ncbi:UTP--glucose-1-phosphate uridylyltransferase [Candidatus Epulonipiscium fishelsonii]|uniref:UTP--glucose-1-phosphate uridylyltransferase n=1 Tax=Candidatus Epulonipiscium fishelsonii TaxID=77094 RepID=A0ACC8XEZ7_9FIRM|nr:UTP--glucose-1-phosphate uridylyltransferase [Epulopiscium sp. SCG-B05WGA-EpuloA1]ONI41696.1 UTP--glucose-1-phosphate uridylyltransferase [Epulopiscium sp. SCG-B11WGA-EpuloA1]
MKKITKAVIPAAGLGTRFLPATKAQPKEMLPIVDKPTIQYIVEEAVASGIEDIVIVTGRTKKSIEDHFDKSIELEMELDHQGKEELLKIAREVSEIANIYYIRQKQPRGLGHAIATAKTFIGDEPFAVLLGDDVITSKKPVLLQMIEKYEKYGRSILGVQNVPREDVPKYGMIVGQLTEDRIYHIEDIIEKPAIENVVSTLAGLGRYILTPTIFEFLEEEEIGSGGEIQLTDAIRKLLKVQNVYAYDFIGKRYDVGSKMGFLQATVEFALRRKDLNQEFKEYLKEIVATF